MSQAPPKIHLAEPPSAYLVRPSLVVDCSVLSAALFQEEARDMALGMLSGKTLHAPFLLDHEIISVALKKGRAGWPEPVITRAIADYAQQAIELHRTDIEAQWRLASLYQLSSYDAAYLWLAADLKVPLATFDAKLATAAQTHMASLT